MVGLVAAYLDEVSFRWAVPQFLMVWWWVKVIEQFLRFGTVRYLKAIFLRYWGSIPVWVLVKAKVNSVRFQE